MSTRAIRWRLVAEAISPFPKRLGPLHPSRLRVRLKHLLPRPDWNLDPDLSGQEVGKAYVRRGVSAISGWSM